jgi:hypothetical protein
VTDVDLEEHSLESAAERCEECGARLTDREIQIALESGGPSLCSIHLTDVVPIADEDAPDAEPPG